MAERWLVVNADDFGFTRDVNDGIVTAHRDGILTATTLMANGPAFDDAVRLSAAHPALDVGCHLVLIGGESLVSGRPLPASVPELIQALVGGRIQIYDELAAQVRRIQAAKIRPLHLDTHKHTHVLPVVLRAVARISHEFGIPWVRHPFDLSEISYLGTTPGTVRWISRMMRLGRPYARRTLARYGCRTTDHFAGFQLTGFLNTPALVRLIGQLPPGRTELMCHPGKFEAELRAAPTRLKESRQRELEALIAPETREALNVAGVRVCGYRGLPVV